MAYLVYDELISPEYNKEYKISSADRKKQILDEVVSIIRSVNKFPIREFDLSDEMDVLRALSLTNVKDVYDFDTKVISKRTTGTVMLGYYFPNIFKAKREGKVGTMFEAFYNDDILKDALKICLGYEKDCSNMLAAIRLTKCGYCTNFKPVTAKVVYESRFMDRNDIRVLDYSAGFGGRLLGAWSSDRVVKYTGIDPNTETHDNAVKFIRRLDMFQKKDLEVLKECSEDFTVKRFPEYRDYYDIAFSSPPLFQP